MANCNWSDNPKENMCKQESIIAPETEAFQRPQLEYLRLVFYVCFEIRIKKPVLTKEYSTRW